MTHPLALKMADAVADLLADPATAPVSPRTTTTERQQLAYGPLGIALLHIERAARSLGPWQRAHDWLTAATRQPFTSGPDSHPFYGAPPSLTPWPARPTTSPVPTRAPWTPSTCRSSPTSARALTPRTAVSMQATCHNWRSST